MENNSRYLLYNMLMQKKDKDPFFDDKNYGKRNDGSDKGSGWLGEIKQTNDKFATELTYDYDTPYGRFSMPLIVPTLTENEIESIRMGEQPTEEMHKKAFKHGLNRILQWKSPYSE